MLKNNQRNFAYTAMLNNENGFSFITVLLTISLIFMTLPFLSYLIRGMDYKANYDEMAVQQFFYFVRDEVIQATDVQLMPSKLILIQPDAKVVSIEQYNKLIRRQLEGTGHEIYLRNVEDFYVTATSHRITISITTLKGDYYEKDIALYGK